MTDQKTTQTLTIGIDLGNKSYETCALNEDGVSLNDRDILGIERNILDEWENALDGSDRTGAQSR